MFRRRPRRCQYSSPVSTSETYFLDLRLGLTMIMGGCLTRTKIAALLPCCGPVARSIGMGIGLIVIDVDMPLTAKQKRGWGGGDRQRHSSLRVRLYASINVEIHNCPMSRSPVCVVLTGHGISSDAKWPTRRCATTCCEADVVETPNFDQGPRQLHRRRAET